MKIANCFILDRINRESHTELIEAHAFRFFSFFLYFQLNLCFKSTQLWIGDRDSRTECACVLDTLSMYDRVVITRVFQSSFTLRWRLKDLISDRSWKLLPYFQIMDSHNIYEYWHFRHFLFISHLLTLGWYYPQNILKKNGRTKIISK